MNNYSPQPMNITGAAILPVYWKLFRRAFELMINREYSEFRREKGLTTVDTLFNFFKMSFLENAVLKYRYPVQFGDKVIIDGNFPPYPSKALDKRLSNYINNLDLTELPSGIVSISTTNSCPYSCAFCSTNALRKTQDDLDEELLKKTISQIEDIGVATMILHGGEPLYKFDRFLRLVEHVNPDTCLWMFTTGYGATPERARALKDNGMFGVWVSLDHYLPEVHNERRGHPKAFDNACRAVQYFKDAGLYTCLSLVPPDDFEQPDNFLKYYKLAKDLGVAEIRIMEIKPSGREACQGVKPHSARLSRLQKELHKSSAYRSYPPINGISTWLEKDPALGCQCRFEYLFVTSTGEVQPCEATEMSFGNIQEEDFVDIYHRASEAFPHPSTGCIPMVMYPQIRRYEKVKNQITSMERSEMAAQIMKGFHAKGRIPGAYATLWSMYERRLKAYKSRLAKKKMAIHAYSSDEGYVSGAATVARSGSK